MQEQHEVTRQVGSSGDLVREERTSDARGSVFRSSVSYDPYAERRNALLKIQQAVYLVFGIVEALVAIRFVLRLLGANPAAAFAAIIYDITAVFVAPFLGIFGVFQVEQAAFEPHSLVAIVMYALLAWVLVKILWLIWGDARNALTTRHREVRAADVEPPTSHPHSTC